MFDVSPQWNPKATEGFISWDAAFAAYPEPCKRMIGVMTHNYLNKQDIWKAILHLSKL